MRDVATACDFTTLSVDDVHFVFVGLIVARYVMYSVRLLHSHCDVMCVVIPLGKLKDRMSTASPPHHLQ